MGRCMALLRGKVDGEKVNKLLRERLEFFLRESVNIIESFINTSDSSGVIDLNNFFINAMARSKWSMAH